MRQALVNLNPERVKENRKYVMRITGDDDEGKAQLDNFIDPEQAYPVIATTSQLLSTGVDAKTCKLIVLDQRIESMTPSSKSSGAARASTRISASSGSPSWISRRPPSCLRTRISTVPPSRFTSRSRAARSSAGCVRRQPRPPKRASRSPVP